MQIINSFSLISLLPSREVIISSLRSIPQKIKQLVLAIFSGLAALSSAFLCRFKRNGKAASLSAKKSIDVAANVLPPSTKEPANIASPSVQQSSSVIVKAPALLAKEWVALDRRCQEYLQMHQESCSLSLFSRLDRLNMEFSNEHSLASYIFSDRGLACLLLPFDQQSKAFFVPHPYFLFGGSELSLNPSTTEGFNFLRDSLALAFACGKEFIVTRLGSPRVNSPSGEMISAGHMVVAAFQSNGQFKIIDTYFDNKIDLQSLTEKLNQAQLKNGSGQLVAFKGEYVNTHLQKGGHECQRFVALYGYQMAKKQDLEAYQEVNGAFLQGKLKTFEDIHHIEGAPRIKDASSVPSGNYRPFMHSWAYRTQNLKVDDWRELTLEDIVNAKMPRSVFILTSSTIYLDAISEEVSLQLDDSSSPLVKPLLSDWQQMKLATFIPKNGERTIIVLEPNQQPRILHLLAGQYMTIIHTTKAGKTKIIKEILNKDKG